MQLILLLVYIYFAKPNNPRYLVRNNRSSLEQMAPQPVFTFFLLLKKISLMIDDDIFLLLSPL